MSEEKNLKVLIEGPKEEVKDILRALSFYVHQNDENFMGILGHKNVSECACNEEAPKAEKKTRTRKTKEAPVEELKSPFPAEAEEVKVEDAEQVLPSEMPTVEADLTPAKELEPAPQEETAPSISKQMTLEALQMYCVRMQQKYPQKNQDEIKAKSRALCFVHGGSETGLAGVPTEKYEAVINAAQENWEPDTDSFGEL